MNGDDELDEEYDDDLENEESHFDSIEPEEINTDNKTEEDFDPLDISDPKSAYFF